MPRRSRRNAPATGWSSPSSREHSERVGRPPSEPANLDQRNVAIQASPLTCPGLLLYTAGLFGWAFATFHFLVAIALGFAGAAAATVLEARGWLANQTRLGLPTPIAGGSDAAIGEAPALRRIPSEQRCPAESAATRRLSHPNRWSRAPAHHRSGSGLTAAAVQRQKVWTPLRQGCRGQGSRRRRLRLRIRREHIGGAGRNRHRHTKPSELNDPSVQ